MLYLLADGKKTIPTEYDCCGDVQRNARNIRRGVTHILLHNLFMLSENQ